MPFMTYNQILLDAAVNDMDNSVFLINEVKKVTRSFYYSKLLSDAETLCKSVKVSSTKLFTELELDNLKNFDAWMCDCMGLVEQQINELETVCSLVRKVKGVTKYHFRKSQLSEVIAFCKAVKSSCLEVYKYLELMRDER